MNHTLITIFQHSEEWLVTWLSGTTPRSKHLPDWEQTSRFVERLTHGEAV